MPRFPLEVYLPETIANLYSSSYLFTYVFIYLFLAKKCYFDQEMWGITLTVGI